MEYAVLYAGRDSDVHTWEQLTDDCNILTEFKESATDFYLYLISGPTI